MKRFRSTLDCFGIGLIAALALMSPMGCESAMDGSDDFFGIGGSDEDEWDDDRDDELEHPR